PPPGPGGAPPPGGWPASLRSSRARAPPSRPALPLPPPSTGGRGASPPCAHATAASQPPAWLRAVRPPARHHACREVLAPRLQALAGGGQDPQVENGDGLRRGPEEGHPRLGRGAVPL